MYVYSLWAAKSEAHLYCDAICQWARGSEVNVDDLTDRTSEASQVILAECVWHLSKPRSARVAFVLDLPVISRKFTTSLSLLVDVLANDTPLWVILECLSICQRRCP